MSKPIALSKHFPHILGGTNILTPWGGGIFSVGSGGDNYDGDGEEKENVSKVNILAKF